MQTFLNSNNFKNQYSEGSKKGAINADTAVVSKPLNIEKPNSQPNPMLTSQEKNDKKSEKKKIAKEQKYQERYTKGKKKKNGNRLKPFESKLQNENGLKKKK